MPIVPEITARKLRKIVSIPKGIAIKRVIKKVKEQIPAEIKAKKDSTKDSILKIVPEFDF
jgi:hypothetical protein